MVSVYSTKRKEPRVKIQTPVDVTITRADGSSTTVETTTIDVSPHGASVRLASPLPVGEVVRFAAKAYNYSTRAVVRSSGPDRAAGGYSVGLEYLDKKNPLIVWQKCGDLTIRGDEPTSR